MRIKWIGSAFVCMTFAFACGSDGDGGSGVDPNVLLTEIEPAESDAVCEFVLGQPVDVREIDCGDGTTIDIQQPDAADIADCADLLDSIGVDAPDCTATVGEFEDCFLDLGQLSDDEACDDTFIPASCEGIFEDPDC